MNGLGTGTCRSGGCGSDGLYSNSSGCGVDGLERGGRDHPRGSPHRDLRLRPRWSSADCSMGGLDRPDGYGDLRWSRVFCGHHIGRQRLLPLHLYRPHPPKMACPQVSGRVGVQGHQGRDGDDQVHEGRNLSRRAPLHLVSYKASISKCDWVFEWGGVTLGRAKNY